jgi:hypothetical protein
MTRTVVIVEDNPICARLYKALLAPLFCKVLLAHSLDEAEQITHEPLAAPSKATPLYLVTALHQAEFAQKIARTTLKDMIFVKKPVASDGLANLVRRHLSSQH